MPLTWSETDKVAWENSHARSRLVIVGHMGKSNLAHDRYPGRQKLTVLCLNAVTGQIVHQQKIFDVAGSQFSHKFNSYASPTPIIEVDPVYVTCGSPGIARVDTKTFNVLWTRRDLICDHFRDADSSPILWGDLLINNHDGADQQYVFALNINSGRNA